MPERRQWFVIGAKLAFNRSRPGACSGTGVDRDDYAGTDAHCGSAR